MTDSSLNAAANNLQIIRSAEVLQELLKNLIGAKELEPNVETVMPKKTLWVAMLTSHRS